MKTVTSQVHKPRERMKGRIVRSQRVRKTQPPFRSGMRRTSQSPGAQRVATETRLAQRAKGKSSMTGSAMFLKGISTTTADRGKKQTAGRTRQSAGAARHKRIRHSVKVKAKTSRHSQQNRKASPKRAKRERLFLVQKKHFRTTPATESIQSVKTRAPRSLPSIPSPWWASSSTRIHVSSRESSWPNAVNRLPVRRLKHKISARTLRVLEDSIPLFPDIAAPTADFDATEENWDNLLREPAETAESELSAESELPLSPHMEYSFPEPCDMSDCALIGEPWNRVMTVFSGDYKIPDEDILLVLMEGLQGGEDTAPVTELDLGAVAM